MRLPDSFKNKMCYMLKDEYPQYEASLSEPMYTCLRVNTLKVSVEEFLRISPFELTPVPWTMNGFYYDASVDTPSKHPFYYAGLYYLQEPSACLPAASLPIDPGDKVLDLCAAPGGKSTELGAKLGGTGLLVSNDISASRLKALQKNIEVFGIKNSIITCETPENLSRVFEAYFDKILIDAPCSGEGMFRKSHAMVTAWEQNGNDKFIRIQRSILKEAVKMLKPGGSILYSTCTFDPGEDEKQVLYLKELDPSLKIEQLNAYNGFVPGNPEWADSDDLDLKKTYHLFPHKIKGEGHYTALLKSYEEEARYATCGQYHINRYKGNVPEIEEFLSHVKLSDNSCLEFRNNKLFLVPAESPELNGMRIMRRGVYLGELKKNRFEPSQSFAMILGKESFDNTVSFTPDDIRTGKYLKGETLDLSEETGLSAGWVLVMVNRFPLGFGKLTNGTLKNKYLPGWRMI